MDRSGSSARSPRLRGRTTVQDGGGVRPLHPPDGAAPGRQQGLPLGRRERGPGKPHTGGGEGVVAPFAGQAVTPVPSGLIHDWVGSVFLPGVTLERTLAMVRDYDHHKDVYQPEVIDSRVISHNGNDFHIYLRLLKKKVITVVLSSEHDVKYTPLDKTRWRSVSRTTRIA